MKITFLGTSHGIPLPGRNSTSLMVQCGGNTYLLDAGAPITEYFYRNNLSIESVKGIFITHAHCDHLGGLTTFLTHANIRSIEARITTVLPRTELLELLPNLIEVTDLKVYDKARLPLQLAEEGVVYEDDALRVTYIKNEHIPCSYSILLEGEGKKILFTGDLSNRLKKNDFPAIALKEPLDLIICEMAHFCVEHITPYLGQIDVKQFWFTHINRPEEKIPAIQALQGNYAYPIHIAEDDDEILL